MKNNKSVIKTIDSKEVPVKDFLLNLLLHHFRDKNMSVYEIEEEKRLLELPETYILKYLKFTGQFTYQFQLCLNRFKGHTKESFDNDFINSASNLYNNRAKELIEELFIFSNENIRHKEFIDYDFRNTRIDDDVWTTLLTEYFDHYGSEILDMDHPWKSRRVRLCRASRTTLENFERKIRKIGHFVCIDDAIEFIKLRVGLNKEYRARKLVADLDELVNDFLFDGETNKIVKKQGNKTTGELVTEAVDRYEVINKPKYLIDKNTYQTAVRSKFKKILNRRKS